MPSRRPSLKVVLILLLPWCTLVLGIWLGAHPRLLIDPVADVLVGPEERRVAIEGLDKIYDTYYREVDRGKLTNAALAGAVEELDDSFSAYLSPTQYGHFEQALDNAFSGVGTAVLGVEDGLRIVTVYPDSPAQKAGLREGDIVTHAKGRKLAGLSEGAATAIIKGPEGTPVTLTIRRGERTLKRRMTRARISVPVVESRIANAGGTRVGYVALSTFGPRTAHVEVADAIRRLKRRKAKGIVLDLRGNGGGLVTEAQLVASMFLADGTIVKTSGRAVESQTLEALGQPIAGKMPTVVLVDRNTASASEIVAGALQDRKRAKLVGVRTFGKGVFQQIIPLDNGGALDITVGRYLLPSGRNLGGAGTKPGDGLKPDVVVRNDADAKGDEQLERALDVLADEL
ncbi:MAG TPA: S41 family peptidase [Solirubrobacteraceae bacterium]|nr:S41 family peptidase [Solirubrobacteraceae bacterium]